MTSDDDRTGRKLPVAPRRGEGPGEKSGTDESPASYEQRVEEAARRLKSSSEDEGLVHDPDRGEEGNKTQRDQEEKLGTGKDRTPPLRPPQDDLA